MYYNRLNDICKENGMSITAFAENVLEINGSSVSRWKGETSPNAKYIAIAAQYFKVSADYLLELSDIKYMSDNDVSSEELEVLNLLKCADSQTRAIAVASVKAIIRSAAEQKGRGSLSNSQLENEAMQDSAI